MSGAMIKGWCPGTLRPMASGDGLLMRVRLPAGRTTPAALLAIAEIGRRFGNGAFDLSQRGQLQMRGLSPQTLPMAWEALAGLGLWPSNEDQERGLCILAAPTMALRPSAPAYAVFSALQAILTADAGFRALPAKFGFAVDDGGAFSVADAGADIAICLETTADRADHAPVFLYAAGESTLAAQTTLARAASDAAVLARAFLTEAPGAGARRMRALTAHMGAKALFASVNFETVSRPLRAGTPLSHILGVHAYDDAVFVGAAAPYGRWSAADLERLAQAALRHGVADIGLSHHRAFLLRLQNSAQARRLAEDLMNEDLANENLTDAGLILDARDARLALAVCSGAPDCASAFVSTREAARRFAPLIAEALVTNPNSSKEGVRLHISGCAKGCAHPAPAPWTLRGTPEGFDLVENGLAGDPARLSGLTLDEAYCAIARRMSGLPMQ